MSAKKNTNKQSATEKLINIKEGLDHLTDSRIETFSESMEKIKGRKKIKETLGEKNENQNLAQVRREVEKIQSDEEIKSGQRITKMQRPEKRSFLRKWGLGAMNLVVAPLGIVKNLFVNFKNTLYKRPREIYQLKALYSGKPAEITQFLKNKFFSEYFNLDGKNQKDTLLLRDVLEVVEDDSLEKGEGARFMGARLVEMLRYYFDQEVARIGRDEMEKIVGRENITDPFDNVIKNDPVIQRLQEEMMKFTRENGVEKVGDFEFLPDEQKAYLQELQRRLGAAVQSHAELVDKSWTEMTKADYSHLTKHTFERLKRFSLVKIVKDPLNQLAELIRLFSGDFVMQGLNKVDLKQIFQKPEFKKDLEAVIVEWQSFKNLKPEARARKIYDKKSKTYEILRMSGLSMPVRYLTQGGRILTLGAGYFGGVGMSAMIGTRAIFEGGAKEARREMLSLSGVNASLAEAFIDQPHLIKNFEMSVEGGFRSIQTTLEMLASQLKTKAAKIAFLKAINQIAGLVIDGSLEKGLGAEAVEKRTLIHTLQKLHDQIMQGKETKSHQELNRLVGLSGALSKTERFTKGKHLKNYVKGLSELVTHPKKITNAFLDVADKISFNLSVGAETTLNNVIHNGIIDGLNYVPKVGSLTSNLYAYSCIATEAATQLAKAPLDVANVMVRGDSHIQERPIQERDRVFSDAYRGSDESKTWLDQNFLKLKSVKEFFAIQNLEAKDRTLILEHIKSRLLEAFSISRLAEYMKTFLTHKPTSEQDKIREKYCQDGIVNFKSREAEMKYGLQDMYTDPVLLLTANNEQTAKSIAIEKGTSVKVYRMKNGKYYYKNSETGKVYRAVIHDGDQLTKTTADAQSSLVPYIAKYISIDGFFSPPLRYEVFKELAGIYGVKLPEARMQDFYRSIYETYHDKNINEDFARDLLEQIVDGKALHDRKNKEIIGFKAKYYTEIPKDIISFENFAKICDLVGFQPTYKEKDIPLRFLYPDLLRSNLKKAGDIDYIKDILVKLSQGYLIYDFKEKSIKENSAKKLDQKSEQVLEAESVKLEEKLAKEKEKETSERIQKELDARFGKIMLYMNRHELGIPETEMSDLYTKFYATYIDLILKDYKEFLVEKGDSLEETFVKLVKWAKENQKEINSDVIREYMNIILHVPLKMDELDHATVEPKQEEKEPPEKIISEQPQEPSYDRNYFIYRSEQNRKTMDSGHYKDYGPVFSIIRKQGDEFGHFTYNRLTGDYKSRLFRFIDDNDKTKEYIYLMDLASSLGMDPPTDLSMMHLNPATFAEKLNTTTKFNRSQDLMLRESLVQSERLLNGNNDLKPADFKILYNADGSVQEVRLQDKKYEPEGFLFDPKELKISEDVKIELEVAGEVFPVSAGEILKQRLYLEKEKANTPQDICIYDQQENNPSMYKNVMWFVESRGPLKDFYTQVAETITKNAASPKDKLLMLAKWVQQNIDYVEDRDEASSEDKKEIIRMAVSTLIDRSGDCEDVSILFKTLADALGFKDEVGIVLFEGHAAVIIKGDYGKTKYMINGEPWTLVELATELGQTLEPGENDTTKSPIYYSFNQGEIMADQNRYITYSIVETAELDEQKVADFYQKIEQLLVYIKQPDNVPKYIPMSFSPEALQKMAADKEKADQYLNHVIALKNSFLAIMQAGKISYEIVTAKNEVNAKVAQYQQKIEEYVKDLGLIEARENLFMNAGNISKQTENYFALANKLSLGLEHFIEKLENLTKGQGTIMELMQKGEQLTPEELTKVKNLLLTMKVMSDGSTSFIQSLEKGIQALEQVDSTVFGMLNREEFLIRLKEQGIDLRAEIINKIKGMRDINSLLQEYSKTYHTNITPDNLDQLTSPQIRDLLLYIKQDITMQSRMIQLGLLQIQEFWVTLQKALTSGN